MLSCRDAARLLSERLDRRLSLWRRMGLRMHMMMCAACRRYKRQVDALHALAVARFGGQTRDSRDESRPLSSEARRRIKAALRKQAP